MANMIQQDLLDQTVVRPMLELKEIIKTIQKTITKRNHKMIDYDRHRATSNKLKAKEQRSFNEEKQLFKVINKRHRQWMGS